MKVVLRSSPSWHNLDWFRFIENIKTISSQSYWNGKLAYMVVTVMTQMYYCSVQFQWFYHNQRKPLGNHYLVYATQTIRAHRNIFFNIHIFIDLSDPSWFQPGTFGYLTAPWTLRPFPSLEWLSNRCLKFYRTNLGYL